MVALCHRIIPFLLLLWHVKFTRGQEDECRNSTFPSGSYCESVESWEDFALWVNETVPGDELYLCPFSIYKGDQLPVFIEWGLSIICVRSNEIDSCTFRGSGTFINVDTDEFTYFQGFDFKDTNDYAVHVLSTDEDATGVTRTFCYCSFSGIYRSSSSRGGAFMTQENAGTVNLLSCSFTNNYSTTRGAAIYTRTNQLNVVGSHFADNTALEWGAAIFSAKEAGLYVESSTFLRNNGLDDYSIVVKPSSGSSVWIDGGDNLSIGGTCTGFFVMADDLCQEFINDDLSTMSSSSELSETIVPLTMSPSLAPTSFSQGICDFEEDDLPCIEVGNFTDIQVAIEASSDVVFCGGFNILKPTDDVIELSDIHNIRCILTCTISGEGTHVEVSGSDSQVRMDNMKFMLSDSSAVRITTSSPNATTTFCRTEFWRNKAHFGGAIFVSRKSGFVNVMSSSFTNNEAFKGGAIFGGAKQLKIIDSVFVNNIATKGGSAVYTFFESDVMIRSSYFALNNVVYDDNYALVVQAGDSLQLRLEEGITDAGENSVVTSGQCEGFYVQSRKACRVFGKTKQKNHQNLDDSHG